MDSDPDTDVLLLQARDNDRQAIERLLERHRGRLRRMVCARIDDRLAARVDPSDVVQETLALAANRLPEFAKSPRVAFYVWLRQMGWETLLQFHRRHLHAQRRSVRREEAFDLGLSRFALRHLANSLVANLDPRQQLLKNELLRQVRTTIEKLPEKDREVLTLLYLEHLKLSEVAEVLGVTKRAATMRHLRALQRLREELAPFLNDE